MGFQMKLNKEEIMNDIDHEKVSQAFGLFVISKLKDEQLGSLLSQFRELFFDVIRSKSKESQPNPNDIEMKQHNDIDIERDVNTVGQRTFLDLEKQMLDLQTDKDSWKKVFSEKLKWV